jgi:hypothetical protein
MKKKDNGEAHWRAFYKRIEKATNGLKELVEAVEAVED